MCSLLGYLCSCFHWFVHTVIWPFVTSVVHLSAVDISQHEDISKFEMKNSEVIFSVNSNPQIHFSAFMCRSALKGFFPTHQNVNCSNFRILCL